MNQNTEVQLLPLSEIYKRYSVEGDFGVGDKGFLHSYIPYYEDALAPYREKEITVMEIGVAQGHSLKMWREYFLNAKIVGCEIWGGCKNYFTDENVELFIGNATFKSFADDINFGIDILVEDSSHFESDQLRIYELFSPKMNENGLYIIEDILNPESTVPKFEALGFTAIDFRKQKNRFDDVILWKKF